VVVVLRDLCIVLVSSLTVSEHTSITSHDHYTLNSGASVPFTDPSPHPARLE